MPERDEHGLTKMQADYTEARVNGLSQDKAKEVSGYSPNRSPSEIERPGGPVDRRIKEILDARGITDDYLAKEYADGIELSKRDGAKDKNLTAHAQYLKQLGYLRGHAKQSPSVAVQINNHNGSSEQVDPNTVKRLVGLIEEELGRREPGGVHEADTGSPDSPSRDGVDQPPIDIQDAGDTGVEGPC